MKDNNFNKLLLCIGESGIGKTDLLKTIFKELHFDYVEFYNSESFKTEIDNYINLKRIDSFFKKNNKKLIFIDDFELFLNDKNSLNYISNINSKKPNSSHQLSFCKNCSILEVIFGEVGFMIELYVSTRLPSGSSNTL